jgi:hypothetical protein
LNSTHKRPYLRLCVDNQFLKVSLDFVLFKNIAYL